MSPELEPQSLAGRWRLLPDRTILRVTGPDRVRFLNGQVSNDVSGPLDQQAVAACLCSLKGKVEALVWIHSEGDALLLDGEGGQRDFLHSRLERYLIADDCEIEDLSDEREVLHHFIEEAPGVSCRRVGEPGRDLLVPKGQAVGAEFPGDKEIGDEEWRLLETLALVPGAGLEIDGTTFPAELGLDAWAVDFHKGCYLGQEIVSRIRSVGRVKRVLELVEASAPVGRGAQWIGSGDREGFATRDSIPQGTGKHVVLALLPRA
jgi:folate-binding protein YgfZ